LIGGAPMGPQLTILSRKPRLIIGTPGRVIDHLHRGSLVLANAGFLVLDEADRMLDMGFAPQLEEIRKKLSPQRQTLLFSATLPGNIQEMGARYLKDPVRITVGTSTQPIQKIDQMVIYTSEANKPPELMGELNERQGSVLIFARTQNRVDRITERLKEQGVKVTRIHGGRTQSQRRQAIEHFRDGSYRVLVATDIAARGLDIHHIAHVINYDLPRNPEDYIHRVGRTARAGAEGSSLCFLTGEDRQQWEKILRLMKVTKESIKSKPSRFGNQTPQPSVGRPHTHGKAPHQGQRPGNHGGGGQRRFEPRQPGREDRPREHRPDHRQDSRPDSGFRKEHTHSGSGSFRGDKPRPQEGFNKFQKDRGFKKNRHPEGRHQKRSEQHHQSFQNRPDQGRPDQVRPESQPSGSFQAGEERQPTDNRSTWERKVFDKKPNYGGNRGQAKGGFSDHRSNDGRPKKQFGTPRHEGGFKRPGFKPRPQGHSNRPDNRPKF